MPDVQQCGGLLEVRTIAGLAPYAQVSPTGSLATRYVMAAIAGALVMEWHWSHRAARLACRKQYLKEGGDIIEKGYIPVPDWPGIGLKMDEEACRKTVQPGTAWVPA